MTGSAPVGRAYDLITERFAAWAATEGSIRAAIVIGSRARQDRAADEWADLDVLVVTDGSSRYVQDADWVDRIGEVWISFVEPIPGASGFERRVLFSGGVDVDFAFFAAGEIEALIQADPRIARETVGRGFRVLFDKDDLVARLLGVSSPTTAGVAAAPDAAALQQVVSDFWYHAVWTAKHLRRGELWWAKGSCDVHMKELLRRMLEWQAAAEGRDPWFRGRFLEEWADRRAVTRLRTAFAHYDEDDVWNALVVTMDLFGDLSRQTAATLRLPHPGTAEQYARTLVERLRSTRPQQPS